MMKLLERQEFIHNRFEMLQADKLDGEIEKILFGLGFTGDDLNKDTAKFSGGWRMRIELAKLLLSKPDALLLDEPNNHLDILSMMWLEKYLKDYSGTVLLISHDLSFLDKIATRIVEIDRGRLYDYVGNYSSYKAYRAERREIEMNEFKAQQRVIQHKEALIDKFRAKANKASFAKSLQKELDRTEIIEAPEDELSSIKLRFQPSRPGGRVALTIENVAKQYGELLVFKNVDLTIERGQKLSFVGGNGQGKSTMVKLICNEIQASEGSIQLGYDVRRGYYAQEHGESLDPQKNVLQTIEDLALPEIRPMVRNILGGLGFAGEDVDKKLRVLSGGEKSRVRLAALLVQEHNLLILDEPTHHLDIPSKQSLKEAIQNYKGTVIVVSHDREFLRGLAEKTISFENKTIKVYEGDIDYYIEKREKDGIQESLLNKQSLSSNNAPKQVMSLDDKRKIQKQLQNAEQAIEKLEKQLKEIELKLGDPEFMLSSQYQSMVSEYESIKSQLVEKNKVWEDLMMSAD